MFASFIASPFNDTHGDLGLFPSHGPSNSGVSIDSIGAEFGGACATSFAGIFSNGVGDASFFWGMVLENCRFFDSKSRIFPFFLELRNWKLGSESVSNQTFVAEIPG